MAGSRGLFRDGWFARTFSRWLDREGRQGEGGVRLRVCLAVALLQLVGLLSACNKGAAADPSWGAGGAGRLCPLLDYDLVERNLGVRFDTAAGGQKDETLTCAVTQAGHPYPFLTVAAAGTTADSLIFEAIVVPSGATGLTGVGIIAYQLNLPPVSGSGPGLEIGWLSASHKLVVLRYVFAPGAADADVAAFVPKLVAFANVTDATLSTAGYVNAS
jgi:hypothetical protein